MSFENFYEFYKDFSLFPDIVNLFQLKKIFSVLSDIFMNENKIKTENIDLSINKSAYSRMHNLPESSKKIIESINFALFMDSLAITAMYFRFDKEFKDLDKLLYLVERMNQSQGFNRLKFKKGKSL